MTFGCRPYAQAQNILKERKCWLLPNMGRGEFCDSMFAHGLSMHQKWSNYTLTNLLFSLYRSMWIIDPLVTCHNPHPKAPACPSTFKVLRAKDTPTPYPSVVSPLDSQLNVLKNLGCVTIDMSINFKYSIFKPPNVTITLTIKWKTF
jgi:hypothetical protein